MDSIHWRTPGRLTMVTMDLSWWGWLGTVLDLTGDLCKHLWWFTLWSSWVFSQVEVGSIWLSKSIQAFRRSRWSRWGSSKVTRLRIELIHRLNWVTDCGRRQVLKNAAAKSVKYVGSVIHRDHFYDALGLSQKEVGMTTQTWTRQEIYSGPSNWSENTKLDFQIPKMRN